MTFKTDRSKADVFPHAHRTNLGLIQLIKHLNESIARITKRNQASLAAIEFLPRP